MKKTQSYRVLNYRVIIEPEIVSGKTVYNAFCPTLEVSDYGDSVDEVLKSIKDGILLAIECLVEDGKSVPVDQTEQQIVATASVRLPLNLRPVFAT